MSDAAFDGAIGIHVGVIYSRVAVWENDDITIIPDKYNNCKIPSCVAFAENGDILVGRDAVDWSDANTKSEALFPTALLGNTFDDWQNEEKLRDLFPYTVVKGENNGIHIQVKCGETVRNLTAEEITAMLLLELKEMAESHLGKTVHKVVLTVLPEHNSIHRRAIMDAATIAGLEVLQLIKTTLTTRVAHGANKSRVSDASCKVIVESDVFHFEAPCVEAVSSAIYAKRAELCWEDDEHVAMHLAACCVKEFKHKNNGKKIATNSHAARRVLMASVQATRQISSKPETTIDLDDLIDGISFTTTICRTIIFPKHESKLATLRRLFYLIMFFVVCAATVIGASNVLLNGIICVLAVMLLSKFIGDRATPIITDNFAAPVRGAAVCAFKLSGGESSRTDNIVVNTATSALIIKDAQNKENSKTVFEDDTQLPVEKSFSVSELRNEGFNIITFEEDCFGTLDLSSVSAESGDASDTEVIFSMDISGIRTVWTKRSNSNERTLLEIKCDGNLNQSTVASLKGKISQYMEQKHEQHREQTPHAEMANLNNEIRELNARMDAAQRKAEMEIMRVKRIVDRKLILKEEMKQREEHTLAESCAYSEIIKSYSEHLDWTDNRIKARQCIEAQELQERDVTEECMTEQLILIQNMVKERLAIVQQRQVEHAEITTRELQRQQNKNETLRTKVEAMERELAMFALEKYALAMRTTIRGSHASSRLDESIREQIANAVNDERRWIQNNPESTLAEYQQRLDALKRICAPVEELTPHSTSASDISQIPRLHESLFYRNWSRESSAASNTPPMHAAQTSLTLANSSTESPNLIDVERNITPSHSSEEEMQAMPLPEDYSNLPN